jgi:hypothetical protein
VSVLVQDVEASLSDEAGMKLTRREVEARFEDTLDRGRLVVRHGERWFQVIRQNHERINRELRS